MTEIERQMQAIRRNVSEIIEEAELRGKLEKALKDNSPLRIKYGIDPTSPEIHLGHTVPIKKLKDFQVLGHKVLFLIGDFTARIGDPTGRKETRPILSVEEIQQNLSRYKDQVARILDLDKTEFVYNSEWLSKLTLEDIIRISSIFTIAQILEREDFTLRYKEGKPISFHEFLYPLLQGYDSVVLKADVEIGATEQKFNLLAGRTIQGALGQEKQVVITMPILVGTDGRMKMSKTYDNYIAVESCPDDMFGKIMSIPDKTMAEYFAFLTEIEPEIFQKKIKENPRQAKSLLAQEIVRQYFGADLAKEAEKKFDRVFKERQMPMDVPEYRVPEELLKEKGGISLAKLLAVSKLAPSNTEAKRLIGQGAVELDEQVITDPFQRVVLRDGQIVKVGKRKFLKIKL